MPINSSHRFNLYLTSFLSLSILFNYNIFFAHLCLTCVLSHLRYSCIFLQFYLPWPLVLCISSSTVSGVCSCHLPLTSWHVCPLFTLSHQLFLIYFLPYIIVFSEFSHILFSLHVKGITVYNQSECVAPDQRQPYSPGKQRAVKVDLLTYTFSPLRLFKTAG